VLSPGGRQLRLVPARDPQADRGSARMRPGVTGVVLAGGRGTRMGGADKGLVELHGRPLAAHALDRLRPQVDALLISANRNHDRYAALGAPVIADASSTFDGPLAGMLAALSRC